MTIMLILTLLALSLATASAIWSRVPLWASVFVLCLMHLLMVVPR